MKRAVLIVCRGAVDKDIRRKTIEELHLSVSERFEETSVVSVVSDAEVRRKIKSAHGETMDSVKVAMMKLQADGVTHLTVLCPSFVSDESYRTVSRDVTELSGVFTEVRVARPILDTEEDVGLVSRAAENVFKAETGGDALILVADGDEGDEDTDKLVDKLEADLRDRIGRRCYIVTHKGKKKLFFALKDMMDDDITEGRVVVAPFEFMTDDESEEYDDIIDRLIYEGYDVDSIYKGLGEYEDFQRLYLRKMYMEK